MHPTVEKSAAGFRNQLPDANVSVRPSPLRKNNSASAKSGGSLTYPPSEKVLRTTPLDCRVWLYRDVMIDGVAHKAGEILMLHIYNAAALEWGQFGDGSGRQLNDDGTMRYFPARQHLRCCRHCQPEQEGQLPNFKAKHDPRGCGMLDLRHTLPYDDEGLPLFPLAGKRKVER